MKLDVLGSGTVEDPFFKEDDQAGKRLIGFDYKNKDNPFFSPPH